MFPNELRTHLQLSAELGEHAPLNIFKCRQAVPDREVSDWVFMVWFQMRDLLNCDYNLAATSHQRLRKSRRNSGAATSIRF
jgi:hypothetical protein